ncbi:MAG: hypothetical protein HY048_00775 [Acidobacteria bacterium]|nr:hypothetical protein [Acidobacteriota bacterium]
MNVERVMEQIRARIREKRGVDYTEQQIQELANVKLEKILDPRGVRSDLLDEFLRMQPTRQPGDITAEAMRTSKLFASHRAPIRFIRRLLRPILKLFINPAPLVQVLEGGARDPLFFELIHNLVVETTRLGIEVKNLKMKVESLTGRLEFNERRARALESVVVYKPSGDEAAAPPPAPPPPRPSRPPARNDYYRPPAPSFNHATAAPSTSGPAAPASAAQGSAGGDRAPQMGGAPFVQGEGPGQRSRRRRRRRGRRSGGGPGGPGAPAQGNNASQAGPGAAPEPDAPRAEPSAEHAPEPQPHDQGTSGHEPDSQ